MTPSDIIVGRLYKKENSCGSVHTAHYLGCGLANWDGEFTVENKFLVIIDDNEYKGLRVKDPEDAIDGFWNSIVLDC